MCLDSDQERKERSLHKILTAFLRHSSVCLHSASCADMNSLELGSEVSTRLVAVFVWQHKLRKTPFCEANVAAQLPVGWSTRSSPCLLRAGAQKVCVIWNMQYKHSLQRFRSVWLTCLLISWVSTDILKLFTLVCNPEKRKREFCKLRNRNHEEMWNFQGCCCFSNIFSFFVEDFVPNASLCSFLAMQKDKPERHEKAEKKPPPKGIDLFILHF